MKKVNLAVLNKLVDRLNERNEKFYTKHYNTTIDAKNPDPELVADIYEMMGICNYMASEAQALAGDYLSTAKVKDDTALPGFPDTLGFLKSGLSNKN